MTYYKLNQISVFFDGNKADEDHPEGKERRNWWYTGAKIIPYTRLEKYFDGDLSRLRRHHSSMCGHGSQMYNSDKRSWVNQPIRNLNYIFKDTFDPDFHLHNLVN